jgi:hypothetical protein
MMAVWFEQARRRFHAQCLSGPITMTKGVPSIADVANGPSREVSIDLIAKLGQLADHAQKPPGQTAGAMFENICLAFLEESLAQLAHIRPGTFRVAKGRTISQFEQYAHLDELRVLADGNRELKTLLGSDYLIKPDVVVIKEALQDHQINRNGTLIDAGIARRTSLRASNGAKASLHASVSCKLTIRSDRVQNTRSEALNLLRNRKGRAPHIVAVTAEPAPSRIAAIALGTGDIDCVYHFALPELVQVLNEQGRDSLDLVETMVNGKRLRDIADLPFDLAI